MSNEHWSEWIEHGGKSIPIYDNCEFYYRLRAGNELKACSQASDYKQSFVHDGSGADIIAYCYKLEDSEMHSDLEWLARNVSEWPHPAVFIKKDKDFPQGFVISERTDLQGRHNWKTHGEWLQARKDLGLIMSDEEAELPAREWVGRLTDSDEEAGVLEGLASGTIGGKRTAENFLMQAADLMAERGKQYDQPGGERSMGKAVAALNAITGRDLTEAEGWLLMSLVKRVRQHSGAGYHQDSAEDAVAYAALEGEALERGS